MALPAGVNRLGSFKGLKGDTGSIAYATAEAVPADADPEVSMVGPVSNRGAHFKIPRGLPGLNGVPTDEAIGTLVGANDTAAGAAVAAKAGTVARATANYANDATAGNLRGLISKLERGVEDATVLWVTDSLGNETSEIPHLVALYLASQYPAYTVLVAFWDETTETGYKTAVSVQTGTGAQTLTVWVCAKQGARPTYVLASRYAVAIAAVPSPDVIFVMHGHNTGGPVTTYGAKEQQRMEFMQLTESVTLTHPLASLVLVAENPSLMAGRETWQATKAQVLERLAGMRGFGFIDGHQAFLDYGPAWATDLMSDQTHPNAAGSALIAGVVNAALASARGASAARIEPSTLLRNGRNLLVNHDFTSWSGTNPDSWTPTNATTSKDTTNYESGVQAAKVTGTATSGASQISQALGAVKARELRGEYVTLAVRMRQPSTNGLIAAAGISDSSGAQARTDMTAGIRDGYLWTFATMRINAAATEVYVRLFTRLSGTDLVETSFDRAYLVRGVLPLAGS